MSQKNNLKYSTKIRSKNKALDHNKVLNHNKALNHKIKNNLKLIIYNYNTEIPLTYNLKAILLPFLQRLIQILTDILLNKHQIAHYLRIQV